MIMNIHYLRYFIAVAEHLNFSKAADHLYIAQPGLSQGIANLERQLGVKLFDRDRRSVKLTAAGKAFLKEAVEITAKLDEAVEKARWVDANWLGDLNLGFLPSLGKILLPQWISEFRQKYPAVNLKLKQYTMATLHIALEHGDLDIGYTRSFALQGTSGFTCQKISTDSISAVMRSDHPLAGQDYIELSELAHEHFIMLAQQEAPQWHNLVVQIFARRGFTPTIIATPDRVDGIYPFVASGLGVGMVPSSNRTCDIPEIRFIHIRGDDAFFDTILTWKTSNTNPAIHLFANTAG